MSEVSTLMMLLKRYLRLELNTLLRNNIRFRVIGRDEELAPDVRGELTAAEEKTAANTGMLFNIALNYGGRAEIVDAARRAIAAGVAADELDEQRFADFLYTAGQPDPDLLIRTSGEMRVSNFLLWQIAYAEIWVTDTLWPDFRKRAPARGDPRLPEARPPLRRHHPAGDRRPMTSGPLRGSRSGRRRSAEGAVTRCGALVLLPVVIGTVWFLPPVGDARPGAASRRAWPSSSTPDSPRRSARSVPRLLAGAAVLAACAAVGGAHVRDRDRRC